MNIAKNDFSFIAKGMADNGLVQFGDFTLASGRKSPIYINLRLLRSLPGLDFDLIADVPTAGTPIAILISQITGIPMITPRMDNKGHGSGAKIDGIFEPREKVLVIDDLVTTAGSKLKAIKILEGAGLIVQDVLVLIDRQQGGVEELASKGYELHAAFTISELLTFLAEEGIIDGERYNAVMSYLSS